MGPGLPYCCLFPDISVKIMNPKYLASLTKKWTRYHLLHGKTQPCKSEIVKEREKNLTYQRSERFEVLTFYISRVLILTYI